MQLRTTTCSLAVSAAFAALIPFNAAAAPTIAFTAPAVGGVLKGNVQGPPNCIVEGSDIARVMFYINDVWTNTDGNLSNGLGCWIDTTKYRDGDYTLKAVAYDARGQTATTTRAIKIQNTVTSTPTTPTGAPTIAFTAPAAGGVLKGNVQGPPNCTVTGENIARVMFYINGVWTNTDGNLDNGLGCWIDTTKYRDGTYTLKAVAYNAAGQTATTERQVLIQNTVAAPTPTPTPGAPTVSFTAPAVNGVLKGDVKGPPNCTVSGDNIARVMFYINGVWTNTDGNLANGLGCWIDTTKYTDGPYTLKAVAYNAAGQTATAERAIVIQNTVATPPPTSGVGGAPTVAFTMPATGGTLSGNVQGPPKCAVTGENIARVMFYIDGVWTNTDGNLTNGLGCWLDTTKYSNGTHTLKAVAYNAAGQTATAERAIVIQNTVTSNTPPTVAFKAPVAGATLKGYVNSTTCEATATDDKGVSRVDFYVGSKLVNTKSAAPYQCAIDTTTFPDGQHTLMAVAVDTNGASATTQRNVTIANSVVTDPDPVPAGKVDATDVVGWASGEVPFAQQSGYSTQVLGTYTQAQSIPEAGIHGSTLSNGETLRLGKETDPRNSARKALSFQLSYSDPNTSGSKRSELSFPHNIEMNKVYWVALRVYVRDWSSESSGGLFGTQLHSGDNSRGLSPSFGIYMSGASNFRVETRYSTSSSPSPSNSITTKHGDHPIKFGQWMDFVIKFKHNTSGNGFLQAWLDGTQIVDYKGNLGFNTPGYKDYAKFGLYNWSSFSKPRKVMLHKPTVVLDPTGSKYDAATLRAYVQ